MALKSLIRKPEEDTPSFEQNDEAALAFIAGAPVHAAPKEKRKRKKAPKFVRTTFSLTKDLNLRIDRISMMPRDFKASRSDVIRAAVMALGHLSKAEIVALLEVASKAEPLTDVEQENEDSSVT